MTIILVTDAANCKGDCGPLDYAPCSLVRGYQCCGGSYLSSQSPVWKCHFEKSTSSKCVVFYLSLEINSKKNSCKLITFFGLVFSAHVRMTVLTHFYQWIVNSSHLEDGCPLGFWRQQAPLKYKLTSTRLHGATTQKTAIFVLATVRTSNLI
jgi:hypothetical protein